MPYYDVNYSSKKAVRSRNKRLEEDIHLRACRYLKTHHKEVDFLTDFSAGMRMSIGQAKKRKAMNSGRGWPDITILKPSRGYYGLLVDIKKDNTSIYVTRGARKGELVADEHIREQAAFMERMNSLGYLARFAVGYKQFTELVDWYLEKDTAETF